MADNSTKLIDKFQTINGIQLHLIEGGDISDKSIIFLHGFPEFWYAWRKQINFFSEKKYHFLVPDQRGYNLSDKPKGVANYQMQHLMQDILALIQSLEKKKVYLVAHDWGAMVAWSLAAFYPQLIEKMVIINVPHPKVLEQTLLKSWEQRFKSWYALAFQIPYLVETFNRISRYHVLARGIKSSAIPGTFTAEDIQQYKTAWQQKGAMTGMVNWYRAVRFFPQLDWPAGQIQVPTLIIWGAKDQFLIRSNAKDSLDKCADGRLHYFEEATHWVHHEKSANVNELIHGFFSK